MKRRGFFGVLAGAAALPVLSVPSGLPADAWLEGLQGGSIIVHPNDAILLPRMAPGVSVVTDPSCPREMAYSVEAPPGDLTLKERIETLQALIDLGVPIAHVRMAELLQLGELSGLVKP
jgi:hypothetical protein